MPKQPLSGTQGGGEQIPLGPGAVSLKLTGWESGGSLTVFEYEVAAGFPGPPRHVHPGFDEFFYVLGGELTFRLEEDEITAAEGAYLYVPGERPHTFANASTESARMLVVASPAGIEGFFRSVGTAAADGRLPSPETMARLNADHGMRPA